MTLVALYMSSRDHTCGLSKVQPADALSAGGSQVAWRQRFNLVSAGRLRQLQLSDLEQGGEDGQ